LYELPGAKEFSFAIVGAEIVTGDAQSASDSQGAIHPADSHGFRTLDVHLEKIDALYVLGLDELIQTKPRDLKRTLRVAVDDAVRVPSFEIFDRHGSGGIDEREVGRRNVLEMI
jgi:hypothetical protein